MRSVSATPPKGEKLTCTRCGLSASKPIVAITNTAGGSKPLCANATACNARVRTAKRRSDRGAQ